MKIHLNTRVSNWTLNHQWKRYRDTFYSSNNTWMHVIDDLINNQPNVNVQSVTIVPIILVNSHYSFLLVQVHQRRLGCLSHLSCCSSPIIFHFRVHHSIFHLCFFYLILKIIYWFLMYWLHAQINWRSKSL